MDDDNDLYSEDEERYSSTTSSDDLSDDSSDDDEEEEAQPGKSKTGTKKDGQAFDPPRDQRASCLKLKVKTVRLFDPVTLSKAAKKDSKTPIASDANFDAAFNGTPIKEKAFELLRQVDARVVKACQNGTKLVQDLILDLRAKGYTRRLTAAEIDAAKAAGFAPPKPPPECLPFKWKVEEKKGKKGKTKTHVQVTYPARDSIKTIFYDELRAQGLMSYVADTVAQNILKLLYPLETFLRMLRGEAYLPDIKQICAEVRATEWRVRIDVQTRTHEHRTKDGSIKKVTKKVYVPFIETAILLKDPEWSGLVQLECYPIKVRHRGSLSLSRTLAAFGCEEGGFAAVAKGVAAMTSGGNSDEVKGQALNNLKNVGKSGTGRLPKKEEKYNEWIAKNPQAIPSLWTKGAIKIKRRQRPGQAPDWFVLLAYYPPKLITTERSGVMVVHRGMANALTTAYVKCTVPLKKLTAKTLRDENGEPLKSEYGEDVPDVFSALPKTPNGEPDLSTVTIHYSMIQGDFILRNKMQMRRRRARMLRDLPQRNQNKQKTRQQRAREMSPLSKIEQNLIDTEIHRLAKDLGYRAHRAAVALVVMDNFTSFLARDEKLLDQEGRKVTAYVRQFPWYKSFQRFGSVLSVRHRIPVVGTSSAYRPQTCPLCGHRAPNNIKRSPKINLPSKKNEYKSDPGQFDCVSCGEFTLNNLDEVTVWNMLISDPKVPIAYRLLARAKLAKKTVMIAEQKNAEREAEDDDDEEDSD